MKLDYMFLSILIPLCPFAAVSDQREIFFFPSPGVICDTQAGYCVDQKGISLELTGDYLGKSYAEILEKKLDNAENLKEFTLSNGVHCDSNERQCYSDRFYPRTDDKKEKTFTSRLFN